MTGKPPIHEPPRSRWWHVLAHRGTWIVLILSTVAIVAGVDRSRGLRPVNGQHPDVVRWANEPLTSILVRGDVVFAVNRGGLFRASRAEKRWAPLKGPPAFPFAGELVESSRYSTSLLYRVDDDRRRDFSYRPGVYASDDDGSSWRLVLPGADLRDVVVTRGAGGWFATIIHGSAPKGFADTSLIRSTDGGRTWATVLSLADPTGVRIEMGEDSENPGDLRVAAWSAGRARYMTFHGARNELAEGQTVGQGCSIRATPNPCGRLEGFEVGARNERMVATLGNYFAGNFGERLSRHPLGLAIGALRYTFPMKGPKVVDVTVALSGLADRAVIYDDPASTAAFSLLGEDPKGGAVDNLKLRVWTNSGWQTPEQATPTPRGRPIEVTPASPYRRRIDLDRMIPFEKPGEYAMYFDFEPFFLSPEPQHAEDARHGRELRLRSAVFYVTITPGPAGGRP